MGGFGVWVLGFFRKKSAFFADSYYGTEEVAFNKYTWYTLTNIQVYLVSIFQDAIYYIASDMKKGRII